MPGRRFIMGERVVLASRMPAYAQDHAFCFECGSFFQLTGNPLAPACTRCESTFVQFLRPPGAENWIRPDSSTGVAFVFDDQLERAQSESFDESPTVKRPIEASALRNLPSMILTEADVETRRKLDSRDPKCHCAICREGFCTVFPVKRLPCNHEFHDNCIVPWLQGNSSCPICRFRLPEAPAEGEEAEDETDLQRLNKKTAVGVPTSADDVTQGTPVGNDVAQGSDGNGLELGNPSAAVRCPSPIMTTPGSIPG